MGFLDFGVQEERSFLGIVRHTVPDGPLDPGMALPVFDFDQRDATSCSYSGPEHRPPCAATLPSMPITGRHG